MLLVSQGNNSGTLQALKSRADLVRLEFWWLYQTIDTSSLLMNKCQSDNTNWGTCVLSSPLHGDVVPWFRVNAKCVCIESGPVWFFSCKQALGLQQLKIQIVKTFIGSTYFSEMATRVRINMWIWKDGFERDLSELRCV